MELSNLEAPGRVLCSQCQQLDISKLWPVEEEVPETGKPILSLGKRPPTVECDLCRLFFGQSPRYTGKYKLHVRFFDYFNASYEGGYYVSGTKPRGSPFLSVLRENKTETYDSSVADEVLQSGVIVYVSNKGQDSSAVGLIDVQSINFEMVRSWISECHKKHKPCQSKTKKSQNSLPYIYLLDCLTGEVLRRESREKYLALSYVWGPPPSQASPQAGTVEKWPRGSFDIDKAPLTVQDAVRVVKELGMKYLWVDKYCINQNADEEKKMMLRSMDQIYQNAEATIVAAYGDNDRAGLPGVSVPRDPQPLFKTASGFFVSSCPPIWTVVAESVWTTRGWTYQEARLSGRCLFFTRHQIYLVCQQETRSETVPWTNGSTEMDTLLNNRALDKVLQGLRPQSDSHFFSDRLQFSQRNLTNQADILDAFRGILSRAPFVTFWGVTVIPRERLKAKLDPHTGLALGMLWSRTDGWAQSVHLHAAKTPRLRRPGFPTWSWTSVIGEISHQQWPDHTALGSYNNAQNGHPVENHARIIFSMKVEGEWVPLDQAIKQHARHILPEDSPVLLVEGDVIQVQLTRTDRKRNRVRPYRVYGCEDLNVLFWESLDFDLDEHAGDREPDSGAEDALILINWSDGTRKNKRRVLMLLLTWVDENIAERRGILSIYNNEFDADVLARIPKSRKTFMLR